MNYSPRHRKQSRRFLPHQLLVRLSVRLVAIFAVFGLALGTSLVAAPAANADEGDTRVVTTHLVDRPDSGEDGNTWATDDLQRTVVIEEISEAAEFGRSHYVLTVTDVGTFTAIEGELTPQDDDGLDMFDYSFKGTVKGGFTSAFTAPSDFASFDRTAVRGVYEGTEPGSSGQWVSLLFGNAQGVLNFVEWSWTYRYKNQVYVQSADGYSGALTG
jgi:hypothetical protein